MTLFLQKHRHIFTLASAILLALAVSACGGNIDLSGAAGLESPTSTITTSVSTEETAVVAEAPTATPLPAATGHIIFASNRDGQTDLYMTSPDGAELTRLTTGAAVDNSSPIRLSPDGTKIAFSATLGGNTDVYVLDLTNNFTTRITDAQEKDSSPSWSPNSQQLAFESFRDGNIEIYIANADGSNPIRLTNDPAGDSNPIWSPVSNEILFTSNRFGNSDLMLLNLNGTVSTLTTSRAPDNAAAWSPDGNLIAYQSFSGDISNICIIGRDGLNQFCPSIPAEYGTPVWSPNGAQIAASTLSNGVYSISLFNSRDGNLQQISQPGIEPRGTPAWSPDGLRLVLQTQADGDMELFSVFVQTNEFTRITAIAGYDGEPTWIVQ